MTTTLMQTNIRYLCEEYLKLNNSDDFFSEVEKMKRLSPLTSKIIELCQMSEVNQNDIFSNFKEKGVLKIIKTFRESSYIEERKQNFKLFASILHNNENLQNQVCELMGVSPLGNIMAVNWFPLKLKERVTTFSSNIILELKTIRPYGDNKYWYWPSGDIKSNENEYNNENVPDPLEFLVGFVYGKYQPQVQLQSKNSKPITNKVVDVHDPSNNTQLHDNSVKHPSLTNARVSKTNFLKSDKSEDEGKPKVLQEKRITPFNPVFVKKLDAKDRDLTPNLDKKQNILKSIELKESAKSIKKDTKDSNKDMLYVNETKISSLTTGVGIKGKNFSNMNNNFAKLQFEYKKVLSTNTKNYSRSIEHESAGSGIKSSSQKYNGGQNQEVTTVKQYLEPTYKKLYKVKKSGGEFP